MPNVLRFISAALTALVIFSSCSKSQADPAPPLAEKYSLSYGDSIFYLHDSGNPNIIEPVQKRAGKYFAFPEGIEIDDDEGEINLARSETGLRYKISFVPDGSTDTFSTIIVIAGINYYDKVYDLSSNDTLALPVYNASISRSIPGNSNFDDGAGCQSAGIWVDTGTAAINLAQTIRTGTFGASPVNGSQKEVELRYRINDGSSRALNKLTIKVYYFNTSADITSDLTQLLNDRQGTLLGANTGYWNGGFPTGEILAGINGTDGTNGIAKPRPPCIIIVGRL